MPPDPIVDEEDYASSEDSDFAPDAAPDHVSSADEDEDEGEVEAADASEATTTTTKRKREPADAAEADDAGFENSGDEAIIGKGQKRRKKGKEGRVSDDEGGVGGFVKTRSQRAHEKAERRAAAAVRGPVTVDVDALWAQMTADPAQQQKQEQQQLASLATAAFAAAAGGAAASEAEADQEPRKDDPSDMIKIKRTYNFAGKVHTEEKLVARDSAEAKLYLAQHKGDDEADDPKKEDDEPDKPPPRKAFRSAFEPVDPILLVSSGRRADLDLGLKGRLQARERAAQAAKKLNTVEKSRMDWAGFVDKEGIQEELALAGKAKGSFAERQQFLARSDALREEEARRARLSSTATTAKMGKV